MKSLREFITESVKTVPLKKVLRNLIGDNPYKKEYLQDEDFFFDLAEKYTDGDFDKLGEWLKQHEKDKVEIEYHSVGDGFYALNFEFEGVKCETELTERPRFR